MTATSLYSHIFQAWTSRQSLDDVFILSTRGKQCCATRWHKVSVGMEFPFRSAHLERSNRDIRHGKWNCPLTMDSYYQMYNLLLLKCRRGSSCNQNGKVVWNVNNSRLFDICWSKLWAFMAFYSTYGDLRRRQQLFIVFQLGFQKL